LRFVMKGGAMNAEWLRRHSRASAGQWELVTVLGSLPSVSVGEWLTADAWWVRDKAWLPVKARVLKTVPPTTGEGLVTCGGLQCRSYCAPGPA
jgi:hypothetical protein